MAERQELEEIANSAHFDYIGLCHARSRKFRFAADMFSYLGSTSLGIFMTVLGNARENNLIAYSGVAFTTASAIFAFNSLRKWLNQKREVQNIEAKIDHQNEVYKSFTGYNAFTYK